MVYELTWLGQLEFGLPLIFVLSYRDKSRRRRRRGGNVGIRRFLPDFQARWKEWETRCLSFPRFPGGVISSRAFHLDVLGA